MAFAELLILCYHAVSERWPSAGAISPAVLDRQIGYLIGRGYQPRTLSDALTAPAGRRTLVVTFDDAFRSVLERGLPVLERHRAPATLFVPTRFADESAQMTWSSLERWLGTQHEPELRCMSWHEIRRVAAAGWEIGSHTCSHPKLNKIGSVRAAAELAASKRACEEELQTECRSLAYPFGLHDESVVGLVAAAGYGNAVTLGERLLGPRERRNPLSLSREGVYRTTRWGQFRLATSPALGRFRAISAFRG